MALADPMMLFLIQPAATFLALVIVWFIQSLIVLYISRKLIFPQLYKFKITEILIAKDKLPAGTKEGATCTFRVVQSTGDEFILEYVKEGEDDTSETMTENPEAVTDRELTALDSQGKE